MTILSGRQREIGQQRVRGDATGGSAHSPLSNRGCVFARDGGTGKDAQNRPGPSLTPGGRGENKQGQREERAMAACAEGVVICIKATRELLAVELSLFSPNKQEVFSV